MLVIVCAGLAAAPGASGIVAEDGGGTPYSAIVTRNVFGLRPPPAPAGPEIKKADPPKIILTGVTTITGVKRVLFKAQLPARPPEPAKEQSYIMREGDVEGQIQVLEIDEKAGAIKFNNYGTEVVLTMDKDAAKLPNTPPAPTPAAGVPVVPGQPPGGFPQAGIPQPQPPVPPVQPQQPVITVSPGPTTTGMRSIPTREMRPANPKYPTPGGPPPPP